MPLKRQVATKTAITVLFILIDQNNHKTNGKRLNKISWKLKTNQDKFGFLSSYAKLNDSKLNVSQANEFRKFTKKAVQQNSSFLCSGFLKMSKLKTTNRWYLNRGKVQLFSDGADWLFVENENSRVHIIGRQKFLAVHWCNNYIQELYCLNWE